MVSNPMPDARFEIWQRGIMVAATEGDPDSARLDIQHYAAQYLDDGPITIKERIKGRMRVVAHASITGESHD